MALNQSSLTRQMMAAAESCRWLAGLTNPESVTTGRHLALALWGYERLRRMPDAGFDGPDRAQCRRMIRYNLRRALAHSEHDRASMVRGGYLADGTVLDRPEAAAHGHVVRQVTIAGCETVDAPEQLHLLEE